MRWRSLLETILRINGYGMVKQGELYRIVPLTDVSHLPIPPERKGDSNSEQETREQGDRDAEHRARPGRPIRRYGATHDLQRRVAGPQQGP